MKVIDRCRFDMLLRVRSFGASHGHMFPATSPVPAAFAAVSTEIDRLEALDVAERSAIQTSRAWKKQAARQALVRGLTRAGSTARVLARANPAVDVLIEGRLPADDQLLLTVGRQFTAKAVPWADGFAAHGIPIAHIEDHIATFEAALQERGTGRDARVKARAEIDGALARAMDAVAVLDVAVANCLQADPVALAVWKHARRVIYPGRARPGSATPEAASDAAPADEPGTVVSLTSPAA